MFRNVGKIRRHRSAARRWRYRPVFDVLETRALPSFAPPTSYTVGTQTDDGVAGVAAGDFRGIGRNDLAVTHTVDSTVNILLNTGDGTFQPAVSYPTGAMNPGLVIVGDFDGDGNLDLVVGGHDPVSIHSLVSILLGNGDGTFHLARTYDSGVGSRGMTVGDFLGNGRLDIAVANFAMVDSTHTSVGILLNNGDGTFQAPYAIPVLGPVRSVAAGDFTGDGRADLAVADGLGIDGVLDPNYPAGMTVLLSNGDGTFTTAGHYLSPATPGDGIINPEYISTADLRNNGITDVIESDYDHNINVFLGNGDGTFQPAVGYDTGAYPRPTAVADLNDDGIPDLVVGNIGNWNDHPPEAGSVAVFLGTGDGTFQDPVQYTPFPYLNVLALADFNGDGLPDLAVTRVHDGHAVGVMLNLGDLVATGTTLPATTGQDFVAVVASFRDAGPEPGQATDYRAVMDWGDGTPLSLGGVSEVGAGTYEVPASHAYAAAGEYQATVTITDNRDPNRTATASTTIDVMDPGGAGRCGEASGRAVAAALPAAPPMPLRPEPAAVANLAETNTEYRMTPVPRPAATQERWPSVEGSPIAETHRPWPSGVTDLLDVLALSLLA